MKPFTLTLHGSLRTFDIPQVMGILNVTPDSFYDGSRTPRSLPDAVQARAEKLIAEGADMIDVGAYSSRPGADDVSADEEIRRLASGLEAVRKAAPDIPISVDTFRADVARWCVTESGADIINDISGGTLDDRMFETVASLRVPYILMHMRGTPSTMQSLTDYPDGVTTGVMSELAPKVERLALMGVSDVIVDPGFGFAKTLEQNYRLLRDLEIFERFGLPLLVGVSRKSMVTRLLGVSAAEALNATTVINTLALERGASILRVHDVKAAREAVDIITCLNEV